MYCPKMSFWRARQAGGPLEWEWDASRTNSGSSSRHHWLDRSIKWTMQLEAGRGTYVRSALLLLCQGKGTNICRCRAMHQRDKPCRMVVLLSQSRQETRREQQNSKAWIRTEEAPARLQ